MRRSVASIFFVGLMVLCVSVVSGQAYPNKSIRLITSLPGGSNDLVARIIAFRLPESLGQPVIVDNRGARLSRVKLWPRHRLMDIP